MQSPNENDLLPAGAQSFTGSFVDVGGVQNGAGYNKAQLLLDLTMGGSATSMDFQVLYLNTPNAADEHQDTIGTNSSGTVTMSPRVYRLGATGKYVVEIEPRGLFFQVQAKENGTPGGTINNAILKLYNENK